MSEVYAVFAFDSAGEAMIAGGSVPKSGALCKVLWKSSSSIGKQGKSKRRSRASGITGSYVFDMVVHPGWFSDGRQQRAASPGQTVFPKTG